MKKILFATVLLFYIKCHAQITLEHTYLAQSGLYGPYLTDIGNYNFKYFTIDINSNSFNLYNIDHTPFMLNINIPASLYSGFYGIGYITNTLFDCDSSNIEYAVLRSVPCDSMTVKFRIFRTDGTLLFSRDSVTTPYCYGCTGGALQFNGIENTNAGTKLLLINCNFDYSVYTLCGTLPEQIKNPFDESSYIKFYPNPASHNITFELDPPSNLNQYKLIIYNSQFQTIRTFDINGYSKINIDTDNFSNDIYYYSLQDNNKVFQSSKFIISK